MAKWNYQNKEDKCVADNAPVSEKTMETTVSVDTILAEIPVPLDAETITITAVVRSDGEVYEISRELTREETRRAVADAIGNKSGKKAC